MDIVILGNLYNDSSKEGECILMKLASLLIDGKAAAAIVIPRGYVLLETLNGVKRTEWPTELEALKKSSELPHLIRWYNAGGKTIVENLSRKLIVETEAAEPTGEVYTAE